MRDELAPPVDPYDPPVNPYDPPLVHVDTSPLPTGERPGPGDGDRRLLLVVVALAAVLGAGAVVLLVQLWPGGGATPSAAVTSAAATPSAVPVPAAPVDPDDVGTWPELQALAAGLGSSLRSVEDGVDTRIALVNGGDETVTLSWIDDEGEQSPYATVEAGQTYVQKTYAGHFWVVSGPDETVIAVFQATDQPGRAQLR